MYFTTIFVYLFVIYITVFVDITVAIAEGQVVEFCQGEDFQPSCARDEALLIQSTHYGSMKIGRCLVKDYGHLGCFADVKHIADRICSGRRTCIIRVSNKDMDDARKCPDDLGRYMEVSYRCQKVLTPQQSRCTRPYDAKTSTKPQYLASLVTKETGCGQSDTPWELQAEPGQRINLTLINFHLDPSEDDEVVKPCMEKLGYLFDSDNEQVVDICKAPQQTKHLYTSHGHNLQILLDKGSLGDNSFLLKYQAIGCPLVELPEGTWSKQEENILNVGCVDSDVSWTMRCHGNHWIGIPKTCAPRRVIPDVTPEVAAVQQVEEENHMQNLLVVTVVGSVTLLGCVVVIVIGVICIKRLSNQIKHQKYQETGSGQNVTLRHSGNRSSVLTSYLPMFDPGNSSNLQHGNQATLIGTVNRNQPAPCLLSHQSSGGEPCVCETQTYKSASDRDSVQYYVLDQDYMANSQLK